MAGATDAPAMPDRRFVGCWLVSVRVGRAPSVLRRDVINPLDADGIVTLLGDGALVACGAPERPVPEHAIQGDRLLVADAHGSWAALGEREAAFRCAAVLYRENGGAVATLFIDGTVEIDPDNDTLSGPYTVESHLTRAWTRNLPALDGSVQAWRLEPPSPTGAPADRG
jgi:hypothetical protein